MSRVVLTAEEARRIHDGTLTEIRRLFFRLDGDRPVYGPGYPKKPKCCAWEGTTDDDGWPLILPLGGKEADFFRAPAPLGKPGDLLWTAEEYALEGLEEGLRLVYRADRAAAWLGDEPGKVFYVASDYEPDGEWIPANRMPKVLSRAKVRLTAVRVERTGDAWEWVYSVEKAQ